MAAPAGRPPAGCGELLAALPATVGPGLARRPVTDPTRTAAWGDPAVTLVCGASRPDPAADRVELGPPQGPTAAFAVDDVGAATTFTTTTTTGRRVRVAVTVPDSYDATLLVPLVPMLAR